MHFPPRLLAAVALRCSLLLALPVFAADAPKPKPQHQYKSDGIEVPAATADEPRVAAFGPDTIRAAAKYLDDGAHHWVREKACVACHSTGVYMVERTALTNLLGAPSAEVLADFIESIPAKAPDPKLVDGVKFYGGAIQAVWRSSGLAAWDRHVAGTLSAHTDRALRNMLLHQSDEGFFKTIKQVEIPYITSDFEFTVQAARALVTAPGWLAGLRDPDLLERLARMKTWLRAHRPGNDYELALQLQLAALLPELVPPDVRATATAMLWRQQQPDGGWSTRRMSDVMKWHASMDPRVVTMIQSEPDAADPASDPYMTAFAIVLLRESGVPASDPRLQRGVGWLKSNQRISGRWWMKSLYKDTYHYITYIATAQALRALALCDEVPAQKRSAEL